MPEALIKDLSARGAAAGKKLVAHFHPDSPPNPDIDTTWANHRWVRYRTAARLLEESLEGLLVADERTRNTLDDLRSAHAKPPSYPFGRTAQRDSALQAYEALLALAQDMRDLRANLDRDNGVEVDTDDPDETGIYAGRYPKPRSRLRVMPRD
jgi:hypothetical protein